MADNVAITAGTGTSIAADDIGGVMHQRVKVTHGDDGSATDASTTNPLPVQLLGEALDAMQAMRMAINALTRTIGQTLPDTAGRAALLGDTAFDVTYHDGATDITYVQMVLNTSAVQLRCMVI